MMPAALVLLHLLNGKPKRDVVTNGINALKAVWHRGAVDADGKTGDGLVYILNLIKISSKTRLLPLDTL